MAVVEPVPFSELVEVSEVKVEPDWAEVHV